MVINASAAAAHNIPTTGNTPAKAKAQLVALRGSHLTRGVSTTSSDAFTWMVALLKLNGLTVGPTGDVNVVTEGTVVTSPAGITIPLHLIAPASDSMWATVGTLASFYTQHHDTVQAFMNALVEANHLTKIHPAQAFRDVQTMYTSTGITSPEEISYLWAGTTPEWINLVPERSGYNRLVQLLNEAGAVSITIPYSVFVNSKFAIQAYKNDGLPVPTAT